MLKYVFFFLLTIGLQAVYAQVTPLESLTMPDLRHKLQESRPDTSRIQILLTISKAELFKSPDKHKIDSAVKYAGMAERLSKNLRYPTGEGRTLLMNALIYNFKGERDKGLAASQSALELFKRLGDDRDMAEAYIIIGQHFHDDGDELTQKIKYYRMAVALFKRTGNKLRAASALLDIGDLLQANGDYKEALFTLHESLTIYRTTNYKSLQVLYDVLGFCSYRFGDYVTGLKYALLAVKTAESENDSTMTSCTIYYRTAAEYYALKDFTKSDLYYQKSIKIAYKFHDTSSIVLVGLELAKNLSALHKFNQAIHLIQQISNFKKVKDPATECRIQARLGAVYLRAKQYENLSRCVRKIIGLHKLLRPDFDLHDIQFSREVVIVYYIVTSHYNKCYPYLKLNNELGQKLKDAYALSVNEYHWYQADSAVRNFKSALDHYRKSRAITDSIFNEESSQIASLQIDAETEKKDDNIKLQARDIELLNKEAQLNRNRLHQSQTTRNLLISGALLLLIIIGLGYNRYRLKQRSNRLLLSQQMEINKQNQSLQLLVKDKDLLLKKVHHRVKNNLQIVMSLLESQSSFLNNNAAKNAILESQNRVQAIALIHQKLYGSTNLVEVNMQVYIPELISYLSNSFDIAAKQIAIEQSVDEVKLDVSQAIPVGIILNEAITNAIKYAFQDSKEAKIWVSVKKANFDDVILKIWDNGTGLHPDFEQQKNKSLGLTLMKGLCQQLEGDFQITNRIGVEIIVSFKINKSIALEYEQTVGRTI